MAFSQELKDRIRAFDGMTQGSLHFAADILGIADHEASGWTRRLDDARRLPDVLYEAASDLRKAAKGIAEKEDAP